MAIQEPVIDCQCDRCFEISDSMDLTSLAGGGWDARNIRPNLERQKWTFDGDKAYCPDCSEEMKETANGQR